MSPREQESRDGGELDRTIAKYSKIGIPVATFVGMLIAGKLQGPPLAVLVLAAGALIGVITALWASLRALLGETPLSGADAYAIAAPRAEEEQKRAVLRALKDLEFERSVGKISEDDYVELVAHYRSEAKRLLRALDEEAQPRRAEAEALFTRRLVDEGLAEGPAGSGAKARVEDEAVEGESVDQPRAATPEKKGKRKKKKRAQGDAVEARPVRRLSDDEAETSETRTDAADEADDATNEPEAAPAADAPAEVAAGTRACVSCGTKNDDDAVFCKKCGAKQEAT